MRNKTIFFYVVVLYAGMASNARACVWCRPEAPIPMLAELADDARHELKQSALLQGWSPQVQCEPLPLCLNQAIEGLPQPDHDRFYTEYLLLYYPKADVITGLLFPSMCEKAVERALQSLLYVLTNAPWRYFANKEGDVALESVHTTIIGEQCACIISALKNSTVGFSGLLEKLQPAGFGRRLSVVQRWQAQGSAHTFAALVAFYLDTLIHELYGFILKEEAGKAQLLHERVQESLPLLAGSAFEERYAGAAKLLGEVVKMLQQRVWAMQEEDDGAAGFLHTGQNGAQPLNTVSSPSAFLDSFLTHYEINVTGKFTHEYHPAILEETAASFAKLEKEFVISGMPIVGRLTLMGYEEQGVTRYKTKYTDVLFSDEQTRRTDAGWSLKMFNRFGLLTGFLCKDAAAFNKTLKGTLPVTHINAEQIEIFDGLGTIFQEHAFGEAYRPTMRAYMASKEQLLKKDLTSFFFGCMRFWHELYSKELKAAGKQHVVGTQDILFSIAYMRYLCQSGVPVQHFYLGPDITYPIETSLLHNKETTKHAQTFLQHFSKKLVPVEGKKTAYVFCSFVDGVGKSTMLGNIQNMMKHGERVEEYEHVDNSSSQLATVFEYSPGVLIADLPAQVSHFTYKPDGFVYVDAAALLAADELASLGAYVAKNEQELKKKWADLLAQAKEMAYDLEVSEQVNPELSFALNLHLLRKTESNAWCSFAHEGRCYLFDSADPRRSLRMRVPLATAPSHGLKNSSPEQMIFTIGLRFPMAYEHFLADLVEQLKQNGAQQVMMVDFVSMYSRSSRENIRVNYLVQQLALLYKDFSLAGSFYQDFVHNAQLLAQFEDPAGKQQLARSLEQESLVRLALHDMLLTHATTNIDGVPLGLLTQQLQEHIAGFEGAVSTYTHSAVARKMNEEHERLLQGYGLSREYLTLQQFNAPDLVALSGLLVSVFTRGVECEAVNELWQSFVGASQVRCTQPAFALTAQPVPGMLDDGTMVEIVAKINPRCRDRQILLPLLRLVRARWHAAATNLLYTRAETHGLVMQEKVPVIPLVALPSADGDICLVQPLLQRAQGDFKQVPQYDLFDVSCDAKKGEGWRMYDDKLYLHAWDTVKSSHGGVYAYGHELSSQPIESQGARSAIVSNLYTSFAQQYGADKVLPPEQLSRMLVHKKESLDANIENWQSQASKNGEMPGNAPLPKALKRGGESPKVYAMSEEQKPGIKLYLRLIATIDMVIKDLEADFALRKNNRADFAAHVRMTECITLPWLFGLFSAEPLFDDYNDVEPFI